jgi:hypothetical protein
MHFPRFDLGLGKNENSLDALKYAVESSSGDVTIKFNTHKPLGLTWRLHTSGLEDGDRQHNKSGNVLVEVKDVQFNSQAEHSGVRMGWTVCKVNGSLVANWEEFQKALELGLADTTMSITFAAGESWGPITGADDVASRLSHSSRWNGKWEPFQQEVFGKPVTTDGVLDTEERTEEVRIRHYGKWHQWYNRRTRRVRTTYDDKTVASNLDVVPVHSASRNTALILAIKSQEDEIAVRLVRRNRALKCELQDSDGRNYESLTQFIPEHQRETRTPDLYEEYPDLCNMFAKATESGRVGVSGRRSDVGLGKVTR